MDRLRAHLRRTAAAASSAAIGGSVAAVALTTPGFTSPISINALLNAISFIGCVAVGMTFITLTGNIMSLCLGATLSASALVFLASLSVGILPAFAAGARCSASSSQRRRACWSAISGPTRSS